MSFILIVALPIHLCEVSVINCYISNIDKVTDEWNQHGLEDIQEEWYQSNDGKSFKVGHYYLSKVELVKDGVGHTKYPTIMLN